MRRLILGLWVHMATGNNRQTNMADDNGAIKKVATADTAIKVSEPIETFRQIKMVETSAAVPASAARGQMPAMSPIEVAIPFPPLN